MLSEATLLCPMPEGDYPVVALSMLMDAVSYGKRDYTYSVVRVLVDSILDEVIEDFDEDNGLCLPDLDLAEIYLSEFSATNYKIIIDLLHSNKMKEGYRVAHVLVKLWTLIPEASEYLWAKFTAPENVPKQLPPPEERA